MYSRERSMREERFPQRRKTPSFSSSLLDAIYRSIDNDASTAGDDDDDFSLYRQTTTTIAIATATTTMRKKQSMAGAAFEGEDDREHDDESSLRRAIMIEKWNEKQRMKKKTSRALFNSASNSSDSSSGGGAFSSSETDSSSYRARSTPSCFTPIRSKHFRTRVSTPLEDQFEKQPKHVGGGSGSGFAKTKLRALKIYGDLKKSKDHPISPGRRIASFLNSLFNAKKEKLCSVDAMEEDPRSKKKSKSTTTTTTPTPCSSASSYSRSCLSKTPPSTGKLSTGDTKMRSVRFHPVSHIVNEDCRPCDQKIVYKDDHRRLMPINKLVSATPFLNEELKTKYKFQVREFRNNGGGGGDDEDDDDDDDDVESYASSDLFEIENLIGIGRYREELPVYETTNLKTNQAIAHGLIL